MFLKKNLAGKNRKFANVERRTFKNERLSKIFRGKHTVRFIDCFLSKTSLVKNLQMFFRGGGVGGEP